MAKRRKKSIIPGFSWKRALGITSAKRKFAKWTGIPTTRQGRKNKARRILLGGGCVMPFVFLFVVIFCIIVLVF